MDSPCPSATLPPPDTVDADKSEVTLTANTPTPLDDSAHAPEVRQAEVRVNVSNDAAEPSPRRSSSSTRVSYSPAGHGKDSHDSITVSQQDAVRALRKYTTLTNTEIFRRVGVSASGGYRYLRGEDIKEKETRGRKRKLDESVVSCIIREIESQPVGEKTKSWEELCKMAGVEDVAPVTLKRAVESAGYYKCNHCQRGTLTGVGDGGHPRRSSSRCVLTVSSDESARHG